MNTRIQSDIKQAMLAKDANTLNVLRSLKNEIMNASLRKGNVNEAVSDVEILSIIRKEISKRQDSITAFEIASREDLISKEKNEIEVLNVYLPAEMSDEDLLTEVKNMIVALNATSKRDMGSVIKALQINLEGRADNKRISKLVGAELPS